MKNISIITENNFCVSCGACSHICPFNNIEIKFSVVKQKWIPHIKSTDNCQKCNGLRNCLSVCPSFSTDYSSLFNSDKNNLFGKIENIYTGYSKNEKIRHKSTSGGILREICQYYINNKNYKIISFRDDNSIDLSVDIINDANDMPCSVYHSLNYENAFNCLKDYNENFIIIGTPCQLTSISKLINKKKFEYLKDRIKLKVALICGNTMERQSINFLNKWYHTSINKISYRGNGRYRNHILTSKKNRIKPFSPKNNNKINDIAHYFSVENMLCQKSCLYCVDHLGYCSDITTGDAWIERCKNDNIGTNIIITRTETGEKHLKEASKMYELHEASKKDLLEGQKEKYCFGSLGETMDSITKEGFKPKFVRTKNTDDIKHYN